MNNFRAVSRAAVVFIALATLLGCQSLSGNKVSSQSSGTLSLSSPTLDFGAVTLGGSKTLTVTLTNSTSSEVVIASAAASDAEFSFASPALPKTLGAGQASPLSIVFKPKAVGSPSATISIASSMPSLSVVLSVSGNGTSAAPGQLSLSPSSISFGNVQTGSSQTQSVTLTNSGGSSVTVTQANVTGVGFSITGLSLPLNLGPGNSATFSAKFAPVSSGNFAGSVAIVSNASNSPLDETFSGTGIAPGTLTVTPNSIAFGSVQVGSSQQQSATLTNTGGASITISQAVISGTGFSMTGISLPLTLAAGQTSTVSVSFAPQSASSASGTATFTSNASNPTLNLSASGTGVLPGALTASASNLSFGNVTVGNVQSLPETLTNTGGSTVIITQATTTSTGFAISGLSLPASLGAGQSVAFTVKFTPASSGSVTGNLAVTSNASNLTLNIPLSGTGVTAGTLTANPTSLSFGSVQIGSSQSLSETLTNTGGSTVTITQATTTGTGFAISGLTLPASLGAGQSVAFTVSFTPSSFGSVSGNLAVTSNASNPTLNIPLAGTGVTAGTLSPNPSTLSFGSVQIGSSQSLSETLTNTGGSTVTITQATATGGGFSLTGLTLPLSLTTGQSKTFTVTFTVQISGSATGNVAITSNASNPTLNIALSGTGVTAGTLTANPTSLSFGTVQVGNSNTLSETLTNSGGSSVTVSQVLASGTGFSVSGISTPFTLTPGQSLTFSAVFTPSTAGSATGSIAVSSNASNPSFTIGLSGTGSALGSLTVSPATLSFGNVVVGSNASLTGTLTASGATVIVSSESVNSSEFTLSGLSFPFTLSAGQSATFTMTFGPQATGLASATVSFVSNASNSPAAEGLNGTGSAAPQHSVDLSWTASTSTVAGYNVYRGSASGGPYTKINTALSLLLTYMDNSVQAGQTYYYVTTAVDSTGTESANSNEVQAVVPTP